MPQPHLDRTGSGANLCPNPTVNGQSPWFIQGSASYDSGTTHLADGSGSIKMTASPDAIISGAMTPATAGTYVISFYMKSNEVPVVLATNLRVPGNVFGGYFTNSAAGIWEECVCTYYLTAAEATNFTLRVAWFHKGDNTTDGTVWIDDFYIGEANEADGRLPTYIEVPEVTRDAFTGTRVKIDSLGGWQVKNTTTEVFEKWFPIGIHVNIGKANWWLKYAPLGWNLNVWAETAANVDLSTTGGLRSMYRLSPFINNPSDPDYGNTTKITNDLAQITTDGNNNWFLGAYWDDENSSEEANMASTITDHWRATNQETSQRMHPIYALEGQHGIARRLVRPSTDTNKHVDLVGTYGNMGEIGAIDWGFVNPSSMLGLNGFTGLFNAENQTFPPSILQMNISGKPAGYFRGSVYTGIIYGVKGIFYFADDLATAGPVELEAWKDEVPEINTETAAAIDIIQTAHWVDGWSVACDLDGDDVRFGPREFNGVKYIIVCNQTAVTKTPTFTLTGVDDAVAVRNFFDSSHVENVISDQFTLTLNGLGTNDTDGTYILEIEETPPPGITYYIQKGESVYIDPADVRGPWEMRFPDPSGLNDGDWFRIIARSQSNTLVTFHGNGKNINRIETATSVAQYDQDMEGNSFHFEYSSTLDEWTWVLGKDLIDATGGGTHPVDLSSDVTGLLGLAYGGLAVNVSAYSGFPYINAGTTIEIDGSGSGDVVRGTGATINTATITNPAISNATITGSFIDPLQIHDTSDDHQYIFTVNELTANRNVELPLLTANDTFVFEAFVQTLTNKTIDLANNTLTGTLAQFNTALSDEDFVSLAGSETLTNKTIAAASNTITMAIADLSDVSGTTGSGNVVRTTSPTISLAILSNPTATTLEINDSDSSHQYTIGVGNLTADRIISLPVPAANTTFAVLDLAQNFTGLQEFDDGINVARATNPGTVTDGMLWYRTDVDVYYGRVAGTIVPIPTVSGEGNNRVAKSDADGNLVCSANFIYTESAGANELVITGSTSGTVQLEGVACTGIFVAQSDVSIGAESNDSLNLITNNTVRFTINAAGTDCTILTNGIQVDDNSTAGNTRLLLYDVDSGLMQRVKAGANGSGSITNHRMLQIPDS